MINYNLVLLALFIALQLFDFYSTWRTLSSNIGVEKNPVMQRLMELLGVVPALAIKTLFTCALATVFYHYGATLTLVLVTLFYAVVMLNNYRVMNRG